jgi:mRNA-degrading endonuclease RelE of RelBE toxin-antitoxin system
MPTPESYTVSLRSRASRETRKLDRQTLARISKAIDGLAEILDLPDVSKLQEQGGSGVFASATGGLVTKLTTRLAQSRS